MTATRRAVLVIVVLIAVMVFIAARLAMFLVGGGVDYRDAYRTLQAAETNLPRDADERERLLLAEAMVDSEPPAGLLPAPKRIHPAGTLATLHYQTFAHDGQALEDWRVRALVPPLPAIEGGRVREGAPLAELTGCPPACRAALERRGGILITRSGDAGIAPEWVLRMPLRRMFDLGSRPLTTQDIEAPTPRQTPVTFRRVEGRDVREPAHIRVTLVDVCAAEVKVASTQEIRFAENAIIPIPLGTRRFRWVQANGCALASLSSIVVQP